MFVGTPGLQHAMVKDMHGKCWFAQLVYIKDIGNVGLIFDQNFLQCVKSRQKRVVSQKQ